ncbi:hypothetical protein, partial [Methylobacterium sp. J-067]|uniref:hypothetical protein n=1 Tax=Methylobacterium sp. J-067 TaxID=2836648 RepID=UPI001FB887FA
MRLALAGERQVGEDRLVHDEAVAHVQPGAGVLALLGLATARVGCGQVRRRGSLLAQRLHRVGNAPGLR